MIKITKRKPAPDTVKVYSIQEIADRKAPPGFYKPHYPNPNEEIRLWIDERFFMWFSTNTSVDDLYSVGDFRTWNQTRTFVRTDETFVFEVSYNTSQGELDAI